MRVLETGSQGVPKVEELVGQEQAVVLAEHGLLGQELVSSS